MRIVLAPYGTRGDIQPMLALGRGLRERGHDVTLAAPVNFAEWTQREGLRFAPVGDDIEQFLRDVGDAAANVVYQTRYLVRELIPLHFAKLPAVCENADCVVGAGVQFAARSVAERYGIPYAYVAYAPVALPSAYHPPAFVRHQRLPRWVNRLLWRLFGAMSRGTMAAAITRGRRSLGLPPVGDVVEHLTAIPLILAVEPALALPPPDLPPNVRVTGPLTLPPTGSLDAALVRFLDAGPPPVLVGFGSMVSDRAREVMQCFASAARDVGCRLLAQAGWTGVRAESLDLDANGMVIGAAPHAHLLPRVRAVIHHGGAGTTTAVATAGRPQLIVPHLLDQYYWARRVHDLGLGPRGRSIHRIRLRDATRALRALISDLRYEEAARALAERLGNIDGVGETIRVLEDVTRRPVTA